MLNNLSIRARLTLAFGTLAALVLAVAGLSLMELGAANDRFLRYTQGLNARATVAAHVRAAVDDRAIAARNLVLVTDAADLATEKAAVTTAHGAVQAQLAQLERLLSADPSATEQARRLAADIAQVENAYGPVALAIVDLALNHQREQAVARMNAECRPLLAALVRATNAYAQYTEQRTQALQTQAAHDYSRQRSELIALCLLAVAAALLAGWWITRGITRPLDLAVQAADRVAAGDLGTPIASGTRDETGRLLAALQRMQASLVGTVQAVRGNAESVSIASAQIAQGNSDLSHRTEEQASALQQTSAAMEQLGSTVHHNAESARQAGELAGSASAIAVRGGTVVGEVVATMNGINDSTRQISEIIGVIDGIAFQTNILALNAAVEAARAGEQGRGFAVVAGEVRHLAHRSAEAAKQIRQLITDSVARVASGAVLADRAGSTMQEIVAAVQRVSELTAAISTASQEQSLGVDQIGQAVAQMDLTTQQNAALVEESAAAAASLQSQASELVDAVAVFRFHAGTVALAEPQRAQSPADARPPADARVLGVSWAGA